MAELYLPDATNWIGALEAGQKAGMTDRRNRAMETAGRLMTGGDYAGAARAVLPVDINAGLQLQKLGTEQQTVERQMKFRQALATHDLPTAQALAAGDPDLSKVFGEYVTNTATTLANYAQPLKGLPLDQARQKYQTEVLPRLHAMGLSGPEYDSWDPTPDNIQQVETTAIGLKEQFDRNKPVTVGNNLVNPVTGKPVYRGPDIKAVTKASGGQVLVDASRLGDGVTDVDGGPAPAPQAGARTPAPIPTGGVYASIAQAAQANGAKPEEVSYLQRLGQVESHGDPAAKNGSSTGLFQFHPDTFAAAGGGNIMDVGDQTKAALVTSRHYRQELTQLGVQPDDANTYIMHQQGPAGGRALLSAPPETNAIAALTPVYGSQKRATQAIVNNGGTKDMTAGQFVSMWRDRWDNGGAPVEAGQGGATPTATSGAGAKPPGVLFDSDSVDDGEKLSDDAIKMEAGMYLRTGQMPALGMKSTVARQQIINEAVKQAKDMGLNAGDIVAGTVNTKAQARALADNETKVAAIKGFEDTALKNADLALSLAPKGGPKGGIPVLNRWIQAGRKNIAGDPDVAAFNLAVGTLADEYAKVVAGASGSTDSVRSEAYNRINGAMTPEQFQRVVATMKREMANRTGSMAAVSDGIRNMIRTGGAPQIAPAPDAPAAGGRPPLSSFRR